MESHQENTSSDLINRVKAPHTSAATSHTWLHGDETEQVLSQMPATEKKIVNSFLNQLADKEKNRSSGSYHKFFDPMAGP